MTDITSAYWIQHEKKIHATFQKHARLYRDVVDAHPLARLPDNFEGRVHETIPRYSGSLPLHPGGSKGIFNSLTPILGMTAAIHTVLREEKWTVDQIGRLSYEVFRRQFDTTPRLLRRLARRFMVSPLFPRFMRKDTRAMQASGRSDTFFAEYTFARRPRPTTTMVCTQCGMIQFMKAAGLEEMYSYCNIFDYAQADSFGLGLTQPSCIGQGDDTCIYHFSRNPEDTSYPAGVGRIVKTDLET